MSEAVEQVDHREDAKTVKLGPREIPIPDAWESVPFEEAIELNPRYEKSGDGPFDYLPMDAVDEEKQTIEYWTQRDRDDCTTTWFKNGDTVYAKITPCTENGKIALINGMNTEVGSGSTEFLVFHPREGVANEQFVYYLANLPEFRSVTISLMEGSTGRQRVPNDVFKGGLQIPLPSLPEQRRIADILSTVDEQIQQTEKIIENYREIKKGVFQEILWTGVEDRGENSLKKEFIGPQTLKVPHSWGVNTLSDLNKSDSPICYGILKTGDYVKGGVPVYQIENITNGDLNTDSLFRVSQDLHEEFSRSIVHGGEILISVIGRVGAVAQVPDEIDEANITRNIARITPQEEYDAAWLKVYLQSKPVQDLISIISSTTTRDSLNIGDLRELTVITPPEEEQKQIGKIASIFDQRILQEVEKLENLQQLKTGLMQDLLTGKTRVSTDY